MSNIRPGNRCPGSGATPPGSVGVQQGAARAWCRRCNRSGIRVRVDGRLYVHARPL